MIVPSPPKYLCQKAFPRITTKFFPGSYSSGRNGRPSIGSTPTTAKYRSEEHTSELQSHRYLHSFPTRRSSDLPKSISQNHHKVFSRLILFGQKRAPKHRLYADHCKVSGAYVGSHHLRRLTIAR